MSPVCEHVGQVSDDWPAVADPACEECARTGTRWVSLRRCLSCGHVGCCDSSPGLHATGHHRESGHPIIRALQPGQDWVWCYVDEMSMRHDDGGWREVDLFYEAGLSFAGEHARAGGTFDLAPDAADSHGFPLGAWVVEMRRRRAAAELDPQQAQALEELPGWRW